MWPFKKKIPPATIIEPPPCKHKWKDFPWYIDAAYYCDTHREVIEIYEPYVCIHCKKRKDILLLDVSNICSSKKEGDKIYEEVQEDYKDQLRPRAVVEDMINDFQLVDRSYLEIAQALKTSPPGIRLELG